MTPAILAGRQLRRCTVHNPTDNSAAVPIRESGRIRDFRSPVCAPGCSYSFSMVMDMQRFPFAEKLPTQYGMASLNRAPFCVSSTPANSAKKPTWRNTRRHSTTSAHSSTSPPALPSCPLSSRPTTLAPTINRAGSMQRLYPAEHQKARTGAPKSAVSLGGQRRGGKRS